MMEVEKGFPIIFEIQKWHKQTPVFLLKTSTRKSSTPVIFGATIFSANWGISNPSSCFINSTSEVINFELDRGN